MIWKGEERDYENGEFPGSIISINKDSLDVGTGSGCYRITQIEIEGKCFTPRGFAEYLQLKKGDSLGG